MSELTVVGMRVVAEVAARGSFSAAARSLGYTQSAVSRQVGLMEDAAGAELFERLPRGVRPTARGTVFLRHTGAILSRLDATMLELANLDEALTDRLTLGAFPTALATLVPRALAGLAEQHPGVSVRLREGGTIAQLRRLRAGQVAVAIIAVGGGLDYELDGLEVDLLMHGEPRVAVAADHPLARRGWAHVTELQDEPWIVGDPDDSGPQFGPWHSLEGDPVIAQRARDWPARLGLAAAGLGLVVIPSLMAEALPPGVRAIRVEDPRPLRRDVLAVTAPGRSHAATALIEALHGEGTRLVAKLDSASAGQPAGTLT